MFRNFHGFFFTLSLLLLCCYLQHCEGFIYRLITETLQNNVAGEPITHERTTWNFDPEASQKRRALFYETNGYRGAKFIERIGLGLDGREHERRARQHARDAGRLNGLHNFIKYPTAAGSYH